MQIYIKLKQAGKRRLILGKQAIEIAIDPSPTLRSFITAVVTQQVAAYNAKTVDVHIINFLSEIKIDDAAAVGKVGFGTIYNDKKADLNKAIQVAMEAHIDGLFVVAFDDKIVEKLDDFVVLNDNSVATFIKLTLLIGH